MTAVPRRAAAAGLCRSRTVCAALIIAGALLMGSSLAIPDTVTALAVIAVGWLVLSFAASYQPPPPDLPAAPPAPKEQDS